MEDWAVQPGSLCACVIDMVNWKGQPVLVFLLQTGRQQADVTFPESTFRERRRM